MAATRYSLQSEGYGLTQNQRNNGASTINAAIQSGDLVPTAPTRVDPNASYKGVAFLLVELNEFTSEASGTRIFNAARSWLSTRATDGAGAAAGRHSYVRLTVVDDVALTRRELRAESPGWATTDTGTQPLDG